MNERRFVLNNIENFLTFELHPDSISGVIPLKPASEWIEFCERECRAAIGTLKNLRYQLSADDFMRHIQLSYADTVVLIDCLSNYEEMLESADPPHELCGFYARLIASIETVIAYLEHSSDNCHELTQSPPDYTLKLQLEGIRQNALVLQAKFKSKAVDPLLQAIITAQLDGISQRRSCSYQQLNYTKNLMEGLSKCLSRNHTEDWTMVLIRCLISLNFNAPAFYDYCRQVLTAVVDKEGRLDRQCSALRFYSKEIETELPRPNLALNPEAPHIKTTLLNFLAAELRFREDELLKQPDASEPGIQAVSVEAKASKLKLNTNVRAMGICINLLTQVEVIILEKSGLKGVLGFFARHFSSAGAGVCR
jgi:hypothetical protein